MIRVRTLLPQRIRTILWGDRSRWGRTIRVDDPDWAEWQNTYSAFYLANQRSGLGLRVNAAGYDVASLVDFSGRTVLEVGAGSGALARHLPTDTDGVDCKLFALDDRLICYYLLQRRAGDPESLEPQKPDEQNYIETRATYTDDGTSWSKSQRLYKPLANLWRPKVHDGTIYIANDYVALDRSDYITAAEEQNSKLYRIELLRSQDGLNWEPVSLMLKGNPYFNVTETAIAFLPDGELFAFTRQNFISRSKPPYTQWTNQSAQMASGGIGGPSLIAFGNDIYVSGRYYGYLKDHGVASSPQTNKIATSLWKFNHQTELFDRIADFPQPAYADLGYTGFVSTDDGVFMVYYSGHEHGETVEARTRKADIYLSKIRIGG